MKATNTLRLFGAMLSAAGRFRYLPLAMALCSGFVPAALAGLSSELDALKKVSRSDAQGQEVVTYEPFAKALPGDEIVYRISYVYTGAESASHVQITGLVPEHMALVPGSEKRAGAETRYSADGGATFSALETLVALEADGSTRPATLEDVDALRWTLTNALAPQESGSIEYRVKLK